MNLEIQGRQFETYLSMDFRCFHEEESETHDMEVEEYSEDRYTLKCLKCGRKIFVMLEFKMKRVQP